MELSKADVNALARRLVRVRASMLEENPFFGLIMMRMGLKLGDRFGTAWTDGSSIWVNPSFLNGISDAECSFVLKHEIMHCCLHHPLRFGRLATEPGIDQDIMAALNNVACDIVVNSNILASSDGDLASITLEGHGVSMHALPDGREGAEFTADQVYRMLLDAYRRQLTDTDGMAALALALGDAKGWDEHIGAPLGGYDWAEEAKWRAWVAEAAASVAAARKAGLCRGDVPLGVRRMIDRHASPKADWRALLAEFLMRDVYDYSFSPPDRRMLGLGGNIVLPGFNAEEESAHGLLFLVDASGSVDDGSLSAACAELNSACMQLDGHIDGWVSFFDAAVTIPRRFEGKISLSDLEPEGGGGTDFAVALSAIGWLQGQGEDVFAVIILTDGWSDYPPESASCGVPTLWLITDRASGRPPWGAVAWM